MTDKVSTEMLYKLNTLQVESTTPFPEPFQIWLLPESTWAQETEESPTLGQASGVGWTGGAGVNICAVLYTHCACTLTPGHTRVHARALRRPPTDTCAHLCTLTCIPTHVQPCALTPHLPTLGNSDLLPISASLALLECRRNGLTPCATLGPGFSLSTGPWVLTRRPPRCWG